MAEPRTRSRRGATTAKVDSQMLEKVAVVEALDRSQAIIEFEMDGTILLANELFLKTMGYSLEQIKGRHHSMFVDEATRNSTEYREFWQKLNRGEFTAGQYRRLAKGNREI
jgi:methyl-accepting chemotaxis protein